MANSEHAPASIESNLERIEAALDRITSATQRAKMVRLETVEQSTQLALRHEILREKVATALTCLDGLITRVAKAQNKEMPIPDTEETDNKA